MARADAHKVDLGGPAGLAINFAGDRVAYHMGVGGTSSIWVADLGRAKSARRVTDGTAFHDHSPRWSANGRYLFFLSNRRSQNSNESLYLLDMHRVDGIYGPSSAENVRSIFDADNINDLSGFEQLDGLHLLQIFDDFGNVRPGVRVPTKLPQEVPGASASGHISAFHPSPLPGTKTLAFVGRQSQNSDNINDIYYATAFSLADDPKWMRKGYVADVAWSGDGAQTVALVRESSDPASARQHGLTFWIENAWYIGSTRCVFDSFGRPLGAVEVDVLEVVEDGGQEAIEDDNDEAVENDKLEVVEDGGLAWVGPHVYFQVRTVRGDATTGTAVWRLDVRDSAILVKASPNRAMHSETSPTACLDPALAAAIAEIRAGRRDLNSTNVCTTVAAGEAGATRATSWRSRGFRVVRGPRPADRPTSDDSDDVLIHLQQDVNEGVHEGVHEGVRERLVLQRANHTLLNTDQAILDFAAATTETAGTILVLARSGEDGRPGELFSMAVSSGELVQLSDHGRVLADVSEGQGGEHEQEQPQEQE